MKLTVLLGAGALAAGTIAAIPAEAQRYGDRDGYHQDWRGRSYRGDNGYRPGYDRGYRGAYGYRGDYRGYRDRRGYRGGDRHRSRGYDGRGYYGRPRVVCRLQPGYYGPVRRCFRTY